MESASRALVVRKDSTVVQERQRDQGAAEQPAVQEDRGKDPDDLPVAARREVQGLDQSLGALDRP